MLKKIITMLFIMAFVACDDNAKIRPDDFALSMVNGIIRSGITNGQDLEEKVNDPGIKNVDTDKDGKTDYIMVKEYTEGPHHHFTYVAHPSSNRGPDIPFAKTSFIQGDDGVIEVHSTFLPVVPDYEEYYYHDTMGHDLRFALWLYEASRPIYVPYVPRTYIYRRTVSTSTFVSVQRTYQTRYNIAPTVRQSRPQSFNPNRQRNANSNSRSSNSNSRPSRPSVSIRSRR